MLAVDIETAYKADPFDFNHTVMELATLCFGEALDPHYFYDCGVTNALYGADDRLYEFKRWRRHDVGSSE